MKIIFLKFSTLLYLIISVSNVMALEESSYFKAKRYQFPVKEHSIIFTSTGFYPNKIVLKEGIKLRLFFTSIDSSGCFFMPDKNIFISSKVNKISEKEIYFEKAGIYKFSCPSNKSFGKVIVLSKNKKHKHRAIASKAFVKVWMPKDY